MKTLIAIAILFVTLLFVTGCSTSLDATKHVRGDNDGYIRVIHGTDTTYINQNLLDITGIK